MYRRSPRIAQRIRAIELKSANARFQGHTCRVKEAHRLLQQYTMTLLDSLVLENKILCSDPALQPGLRRMCDILLNNNPSNVTYVYCTSILALINAEY